MIFIDPVYGGITYTHSDGRAEFIPGTPTECCNEVLKRVCSKDENGDDYQLDVMLDTAGIGGIYADRFANLGIRFKRKPFVKNNATGTIQKT